MILLAAAAWLLGRTLGGQTVQGQVTELGTTVVVATGTIVLLDERGAEVASGPVTAGQFSLVAPQAGRYRLRFQAVGYRTTLTPAFELSARGTLGLSLHVRPQPAVRLDTVDVAGEPVPARLADFYRRRAEGGGSFITRAQFEHTAPTRVTDVLRRMTGLTILANPDFGTNGDMREYVVLNGRLGLFQARLCQVHVYLDGAYMGNTLTLNLDDFVDVDRIEAIETYNGAANMPVQFNRAGSECGVLAVWTREPTPSAALSTRHLELGLQTGALMTRGGFTAGRVGAHLSVTFVGPIDLQGGVNVVPNAAVRGFTSTRAGWQAFANLRGRPLGARSLWYVGVGGSVLQIWGQAGGGFETRREVGQFALLTGVTVPVGAFRPSVDVHVLDAFSADRREVYLSTGVAFRFY